MLMINGFTFELLLSSIHSNRNFCLKGLSCVWQCTDAFLDMDIGSYDLN